LSAGRSPLTPCAPSKIWSGERWWPCHSSRPKIAVEPDYGFVPEGASPRLSWNGGDGAQFGLLKITVRTSQPSSTDRGYPLIQQTCQLTEKPNISIKKVKYNSYFFLPLIEIVSIRISVPKKKFRCLCFWNLLNCLPS